MLSDYQKFIHKSRYARYLDEENRRETWEETVQRYAKFWQDKEMPLPSAVVTSILNMDVVPSMRALMTAGPALERDNMAGYNCAFIAVDHIRAFDENLYALLCGTGVGFSVERQFISKLPEVPDLDDSETVIVVRDSKEGWAKALRQLIALLYSGEIPKWDMSRVRPAGSRLKVFGGRASGPAPLIDLFNFTVKIFKDAQGRSFREGLVFQARERCSPPSSGSLCTRSR